MRINGDNVANQGSWPSIAYFTWNYKGDYILPTGVTVTVIANQISCQGTLISTRKIITSGSKKIKITFQLINQLLEKRSIVDIEN